MPTPYSVTIVTDEEFDALPYKHVTESLGLADPHNGRAFVRYQQTPALTAYLLDHEFHHLIEETPTDEEDGIRYKKKGLGGLFGSRAGKGSAIGGIIGAILGLPIGQPGLGFTVGSGIGGTIGRAQDVRRAQKAAGMSLTPAAEVPSPLSAFRPELTGVSGTEQPLPGLRGTLPGGTLYGGGVGGATGLASLDPELLMRLKGFFAGRDPLSGIGL